MKNGIKRVDIETKISIVVLTEQLEEDDKKLFLNVFNKITGILGLYFIDIPREKENNFWHENFGNVNEKLQFSRANVQGKIMQKYKLFFHFHQKPW